MSARTPSRARTRTDPARAASACGRRGRSAPARDSTASRTRSRTSSRRCPRPARASGAACGRRGRATAAARALPACPAPGRTCRRAGRGTAARSTATRAGSRPRRTRGRRGCRAAATRSSDTTSGGGSALSEAQAVAVRVGRARPRGVVVIGGLEACVESLPRSRRRRRRRSTRACPAARRRCVRRGRSRDPSRWTATKSGAPSANGASTPFRTERVYHQAIARSASARREGTGMTCDHARTMTNQRPAWRMSPPPSSRASSSGRK